MTKDEFRKKMTTTQRLADAQLKKKTVESIVEQVDASNGTGDVTIPAGQAAFLLKEYGRTIAVLKAWESIGV